MTDNTKPMSWLKATAIFVACAVATVAGTMALTAGIMHAKNYTIAGICCLGVATFSVSSIKAIRDGHVGSAVFFGAIALCMAALVIAAIGPVFFPEGDDA